jgi:hypothetical protein
MTLNTSSNLRNSDNSLDRSSEAAGPICSTSRCEFGTGQMPNGSSEKWKDPFRVGTHLDKTPQVEFALRSQ